MPLPLPLPLVDPRDAPRRPRRPGPHQHRQGHYRSRLRGLCLDIDDACQGVLDYGKALGTHPLGVFCGNCQLGTVGLVKALFIAPQSEVRCFRQEEAFAQEW
jgi:hypothetical protein